LEKINYTLEYPIHKIGDIVLTRPYRFDFAIIDDNNNPIRFIEFDGEQHYKESHGYYMARDNLKR
jgi:hypothetical protein